ncbi:MAG: bifunctional hydroxymethylpyrimidine kinase/phosphomethylpyrimidine kinase [Burkholderiaceae bacterium]
MNVKPLHTSPNVLSIAGVDPSGGAGVFADLKAFSALGAYGCGVVVALTAQNTQGVTGVSLTPPEFVAAQIDTLFADVQISAIKIGMLGSAELVTQVADRLRSVAKGIPIVLDPVMVAKSGDALLAPDATAALISELLPLATVLTPNLPEAGVLLDSSAPESVDQMRVVAEKLRHLMQVPGAWVLLKGGHLMDGPAVDLLYNGEQLIELSSPRVATRNTHGTGCTLSAAIAALLPQRDTTPEAVADAKAYLSQAIGAADLLQVGSGHGPVHHFHQLWQNLPTA